MSATNPQPPDTAKINGGPSPVRDTDWDLQFTTGSYLCNHGCFQCKKVQQQRWTDILKGMTQLLYKFAGLRGTLLNPQNRK